MKSNQVNTNQPTNHRIQLPIVGFNFANLATVKMGDPKGKETPQIQFQCVCACLLLRAISGACSHGCRETCCIFAYWGFSGKSNHLTVKIYFLPPLQRQPIGKVTEGSWFLPPRPGEVGAKSSCSSRPLPRTDPPCPLGYVSPGFGDPPKWLWAKVDGIYHILGTRFGLF